jgi:hypothetical protein
MMRQTHELKKALQALDESQAKASYTSSLRAHTLEA